MVDVAADDAVALPAACLCRHRLLEIADVVDGILDLELGPVRQRPVGQAETPAKPIRRPICRKRQRVGVLAQRRKRPRMPHDEIELIGMGDEVALASTVSCTASATTSMPPKWVPK